jgi:hypothetical protein
VKDLIVPFSPLDRGFLTGKIDDKTTFDTTDTRNIVPRCTPENRGESEWMAESPAFLNRADGTAVLPFNTRRTGFVCTPSQPAKYGMVLALQGQMFSER